MQIDFINYLLASSPIAATLAAHSSSGKPLINWITRPDGELGLPALTLVTVSTIPQYGQDGRSGLEPSRIQFNLWGSTALEARAAYVAIRSVLTPEDTPFASFDHGGTHFHKILEELAGRDLPVSDLDGGERVFHVSADFVIWHKPINGA